METIAEMQGTGRRLVGPGFAWYEVLDTQGLKHCAIVVDAAHRDHPALHSDLEFGLGFMQQPEVTGLARLVRQSPDEGAFIYPTGTVWSVAEIVRELAAMGDVGGVKAGLELCYMAGEILVEGVDKSMQSGLSGHGSIDPWKIVLKADGQVSILGYGMPRPEIETFLDDDTRLPAEDGFRYCAPENLRDEPVGDIGSDLFSLSLVALELMVGKPVYDGLVSDVRQQAVRGEAARKLYQWRDRLPDAVREVLGKALKPDPDIRFRDGLDFVYSVHDLLGGIDAGDGPSLREVVAQVRARQKRGSAVMGGHTGALTREELAELAADIDAQGVATELPRPRQPRPASEDEGGERPRWQRATRNSRSDVRAPRRSRGEAESPFAPTPEPPPADSARDRLLRRLKDRSEPATPAPRPPAAPTEVASKRSARKGGRAAALLERLRSSDSIPPSASLTSEMLGLPEPPRRRRGEVPTAAPTVVDPGPPVVAPAPTIVTPRLPPTPEPVKPREVSPTIVAPAPTAATAGSRSRASIAISHGSQTIHLERSTQDAGALASLAAQQLHLPSVDLLGTRVAGWRLLGPGRAVLASNTPSNTLPDTVVLDQVDNTPRLTKVRGLDGSLTLLALGAAVPMADLKPGLARLFGLTEKIRLHHAGRDLADHEMLADLSEPDLEIRQ